MSPAALKCRFTGNSHTVVLTMRSHSPAVERRAEEPRGWQPWAWCNLGRNPFGELTREERVQVAVVDVASISGRLRCRQMALQLIGDAGRGKTTRMLVLQHQLADSAYVYLAEDEPCPAIPRGCPLLVDEAQRLPRRVRRAVFAAGLPLVLATHRDLTRPLRRAGYSVHTEQIGKPPDPALVREIVNRRIEWCRMGDGPVPQLSLRDAAWLVSRFDSDLRAMEAYLYDQVQRQTYSDGQMRLID